MKSTILWTLIITNAMLVGAFYSRFARPNTASAQITPPAQRRPGDFLMISGEINAGNSGIVYIVDTTNGLLGAMTYDDSLRRIDVMPVIDINQAFNQYKPPAAPTRNR